GAIGINMSTYVGFLTSGVPGAICATLALAAPSVVIIVLIAKCMEQFKNSPVVSAIFHGLRPASTGLIVAAGLSVAQMAFLKSDAGANILSTLNLPAIGLAVVLFILLRKFKLHPIAYIGAAAVIGCIFQL
ncbi:MAG: chromate transporter, partial [Butyricicoccus pullicaecorum]